MRPLPGDFWGLLSRQILAGLALLLAAAVLSVVLFPAAHGSFVNTHGPATAFRSRRLFLIINLLLTMLVAVACARSHSQLIFYPSTHRAWRDLAGLGPLADLGSSAVLQC